jgi:mRNA-degrading endonuclease RelE of RelBE toxin-antitoxin system
MEFFEAPPFTRYLRDYLADEGYRGLQYLLAKNPELGDMMPGTGGFRKLRWADSRRGKGRRGGLRIIYYYFASEKQIWLMTLYGKNEADDLTAAEKSALRDAIAAELKARARKKPRKPPTHER